MRIERLSNNGKRALVNRINWRADERHDVQALWFAECLKNEHSFIFAGTRALRHVVIHSMRALAMCHRIFYASQTTSCSTSRSCTYSMLFCRWHLHTDKKHNLFVKDEPSTTIIPSLSAYLTATTLLRIVDRRDRSRPRDDTCHFDNCCNGKTPVCYIVTHESDLQTA